jgi:hypothetical protein
MELPDIYWLPRKISRIRDKFYELPNLKLSNECWSLISYKYMIDKIMNGFLILECSKLVMKDNFIYFEELQT